MSANGHRDARRVAIVGAGQSGLQLALGLLQQGYEVTVVSNRTPEEIAVGPVLSSQCMFETALQAERVLGIDHWSATATVLELIPRRRVQPTAAYFRAGRDLLEALAHALPQPAVPRPSAAVPARARADAQGPQLHPGLAGADMLDLTAPNH